MRVFMGAFSILAFSLLHVSADAQESKVEVKSKANAEVKSKEKDPTVERRDERRKERRVDAVDQQADLKVDTKEDHRKSDAKTTHVLRGNSDEQLAAVIRADCNNEVQLAKFALPMLQSDAAKQFAERMIKDHQSQCDKLEKMAGNYHQGTPIAASETKATLEFGRLKLEASGGTVRGQADANSTHTMRHLDWVHIQQQIANECLTSAKRELQRNEGKHFDECFIGMQIAAHMKMVDQLKVFQQYASTNLRGQIDAGLETAQAHLKEATKIMESQAKAADKSASSK